MYSKVDLIENEKMNEIIRKNRERMRKQIKVEKKTSLKDKVFMFIASAIFMFGLMYFISVIESLRF